MVSRMQNGGSELFYTLTTASGRVFLLYGDTYARGIFDDMVKGEDFTIASEGFHFRAVKNKKVVKLYRLEIRV